MYAQNMWCRGADAIRTVKKKAGFILVRANATIA